MGDGKAKMANSICKIPTKVFIDKTAQLAHVHEKKCRCVMTFTLLFIIVCNIAVYSNEIRVKKRLKRDSSVSIER